MRRLILVFAGMLLAAGLTTSCSSPTAPGGVTPPTGDGAVLPPTTSFPASEVYTSPAGYIDAPGGPVQLKAGLFTVRPKELMPGRYSVLPPRMGNINVNFIVDVSCEAPQNPRDPKGYHISWVLVDAALNEIKPWYGGGINETVKPCGVLTGDNYGAAIYMANITQVVYGAAIILVAEEGGGASVHMPPIGVIPTEWHP